jgi:hypothetical protein
LMQSHSFVANLSALAELPPLCFSCLARFHLVLGLWVQGTPFHLFWDPCGKFRGWIQLLILRLSGSIHLLLKVGLDV